MTTGSASAAEVTTTLEPDVVVNSTPTRPLPPDISGVKTAGDGDGDSDVVDDIVGVCVAVTEAVVDTFVHAADPIALVVPKLQLVHVPAALELYVPAEQFEQTTCPDSEY